MLSKAASAKAIRRLFRGRLVADLDDLFEALDTHSRMSVYRRLRDVGYLSSYTHRGRYYTLADIPTFDEYGLWRYQAIGFSRLGTIKATIAQRVEEAEAGCTHRELEALLQIQVYDTLLELVRTGRVRREPIDGLYLYLSTDPDRGSRQLAMRRQQVAQVAQVPGLPPRETVLLVLVEALHASEGLAPDSVVARRLVARGSDVSADQVAQVAQVPTLPPRETVLLVLVEALHASEGLAPASVVARRLVARGSDVSADQVAHVYAHFGLEPGKKTAVPP